MTKPRTCLYLIRQDAGREAIYEQAFKEVRQLQIDESQVSTTAVSNSGLKKIFDLLRVTNALLEEESLLRKKRGAK